MFILNNLLMFEPYKEASLLIFKLINNNKRNVKDIKVKVYQVILYLSKFISYFTF